MRYAPFLALVLVALPSPPALAEECTLTTTQPDLDTGENGVVGRYYVDYMDLQNVWIYEGSNGVGGMPRQDEHQDDTCGGIFPSDTLLVE